jgi:hypothetical protein
MSFSKYGGGWKSNDKMITNDTKQWILMHTNDKMETKDTKFGC